MFIGENPYCCYLGFSRPQQEDSLLGDLCSPASRQLLLLQPQPQKFSLEEISTQNGPPKKNLIK